MCQHISTEVCLGCEHVVIIRNTNKCHVLFFLKDCLLLLPVIIMVLLMASSLRKPSLDHLCYNLLSLDSIGSSNLSTSLTTSFTRLLLKPSLCLNVSLLFPVRHHTLSSSNAISLSSLLHSVFLLSSRYLFYLLISSLPVVGSHQDCY